jgi:KDO2-lipid IV(A) lauroyltransferase
MPLDARVPYCYHWRKSAAISRMKDAFKKLRYSLGSVAISVVEILIPLIPVPVISLVFDLISAATYPILLIVPDFRKVVLPNLDIAFGDTLTKAQKRRTGTRAMRRLFKMIPICIYYARPRNHAKIARDVTFVGLERIERAMAGGTGVIALQAHFGNFMLMTIAFARSGLPYTIVTKEPRNRMLRERYIAWKEVIGVSFIDADTGARATRDILRGLSRNRIIALVADERKKRDGIPVPFFGRPALTTPGPAVLSLRTGAPIIPTFIVERGRGRHVVEIGAPLSVERTGDYAADILRLTEEANRAIEDYVRRYPDQWAWTNPRWRK